MTLNEKIFQIYPELENLLNNPFRSPIYILQDDSNGNGPYIKIWNYSEPQPTQEQLDALDEDL